METKIEKYKKNIKMESTRVLENLLDDYIWQNERLIAKNDLKIKIIKEELEDREITICEEVNGDCEICKYKCF